jgi:hypothetical protein
MTKHVTDKPRVPQASRRLKTYTAIERDEAGPHPQTAALQKRPKGIAAGSKRLKEFTRIERGGRA